MEDSKTSTNCRKRKSNDANCENKQQLLNEIEQGEIVVRLEQPPQKVAKINSDNNSNINSSLNCENADITKVDCEEGELVDENSALIVEINNGDIIDDSESIDKSQSIAVCENEIVIVKDSAIVTDNIQKEIIDVGKSLQTDNCRNNTVEIQPQLESTVNIEKQQIEKQQIEKQKIEKMPLNIIDKTTITNTDDSHQQDDKPLITVSFKTRQAFDCYAKEFSEFFTKFLHFDINENTDKLSINISETLNLDEWVIIDDVTTTVENESIKSKKNKKKADKKNKAKAKKELFVLDANPNMDNHTSSPMLKYGSKFGVIDNEVKEVGKPEEKMQMSTCFNCDGAHSLRDCKERKDFNKINLARRSFKMKYTFSARYHLEEDQKYSHLHPGVISEALRGALRLRPHEIPPYVYRMRVFGYPPGWIEEATEEASAMTLFGIDGEVVKEGSGVRKSYFNEDKLVLYPGFNVPFEKGTKDDYKFFNTPPYSEMHSKDNMVKYIRNLEAKTNDNLEICDMDLDQSQDPIFLPPGIDLESSSNDTKSSLIDLESQKLQLLAELDTNSDEKTQISATTTEKPEETVEESTELNKTLLNDTNSLIEQQNSTPNSSLKLSAFGTPIIKSNSPYARLPNADNFSKGVSPVINFENLPNSTGKYEQMTGVITKVRETMKSIQDSV